MSSTDHVPPQQVPSNGVTQPVQTVTVTGTVPPASNGTDSLQCQWAGCGDRAASAEQLYEHVCERHVGRKSTNNLNLTCGWGNCRTATVKRDHITSHIRVHVPLKPHKCDFCGKSFKRPQDLKKHVKTHADDSVIMHSPEPANANRQHHHGAGGYNMGNQQRAPGFYNDSSLPSNVTMAYGYQGHTGSQGYYAPTAQQTSTSYGPVYYNVNSGPDIGSNASYESRKRGFDTLNEFFGDAKRRNFDPSSYAEVGNRLLAFQGVQLPIPLGGGGMADYPAQSMVSTQGGGVYGPTASHGYALPPMPNLRTKSDLTAIDHILEQMSGSAYENAGSANASGVAHVGAQHISRGMSLRHSNSPPAGLQLPTNHMSTASNHGSTPDLTPGSTVVSYSSGHSPRSEASNSGMSPPMIGTSMYPTLPATATSNPNMAPSSNLGTQFNHDIRRPHSGGTLQKAQPARGAVEVKHEVDAGHDDSMDVDDAPASNADTPISTHNNVSSPKISKDNIDPALAGGFGASESSDSPTPPAVASAEVDESWVENMRLLEAMRAFVKGRLERGEWEDDDNNHNSHNVETSRGTVKNEEGEMGMGGGLYPVLREVGVGAE